MGLTYTRKNILASTASRLYAARCRPCALSPYVLMSDPARLPDVLKAAHALPKGSALIYRHFGAPDKYQTARALRQICFARGIQFLIGKDEELARRCGADGLHIPHKDLERGGALRVRYPKWILSGAAHDIRSLAMCAPLGAAILSPVFASKSPSAGPPLGVDGFKNMASASPVPVFALGGINEYTAPALLGCCAAGIAGVSAFASRRV